MRYEVARDVLDAVACIVRELELEHIDPGRVLAVRSWGARTRAVARIHALPSAWRFALDAEPMYLVEVIGERFDGLSGEDKVRVLIHELLHIPQRFSGGLRPHGRLVNGRRVDALYRKLGGRCGWNGRPSPGQRG